MGKQAKVDNKSIYDSKWENMVDQKLFGPAARWEREMILEIIRRHIKKDSIRDMLDMGCGEGTVTNAISSHFPSAKIKGIDFSRTGIECARRNYGSANMRFMLDNTNMNLRKFRYDLICCFEVLEHVDSWQGLLSDICRSSRKYVMLSFPTGRMRPFEKNMGHVRNLKKYEVEQFMKSKGFTPLDIYYAGFPFYSPVYREVCNMMNIGSDRFSLSKFTWKQKMVSLLLYVFFRFLSTKRILGDEFIGLFVRERSNGK